jgi:hypothetical protein
MTKEMRKGIWVSSESYQVRLIADDIILMQLGIGHWVLGIGHWFFPLPKFYSYLT